MPEISVIIPVYKVEQYLCQCLDSILSQTFTDYECILVDDCSPDNCPEICDEYAAKDKRFRVIHKNKNEGLSAARKTGMQSVKTEYVTHVDSDDWLPADALELLMIAANKPGIQMVIGNVCRVTLKGSLIKEFPQMNTLMEPMTYFFLHGCVSLWGKLYKTELFNDIGISPYQIGEDAITNVQIFRKLKNHEIINLHSVVYNYRSNQLSMLGNLQKSGYFPFESYPYFIYRQWIGEYLKKINVSDEVIKAYSKYLAGSMSIYLLNISNIKRADLDILYSYYKNLNKKMISRIIRLFIFSYVHLPRIVSITLRIYRLFCNKKSG